MDQLNYLYSMLGENKIREIVKKFYVNMDHPKYLKIRQMHPESLSLSEEKLFLFLIGRFGGPQTYIEKYGHPRMRMRHMPFPIDKEASELWLGCMVEALDSCEISQETNDLMLLFFVQFSQMMINK